MDAVNTTLALLRRSNMTLWLWMLLDAGGCSYHGPKMDLLNLVVSVALIACIIGFMFALAIVVTVQVRRDRVLESLARIGERTQ